MENKRRWEEGSGCIPVVKFLCAIAEEPHNNPLNKKKGADDD
jgi:hypothetical protein